MGNQFFRRYNFGPRIFVEESEVGFSAEVFPSAVSNFRREDVRVAVENHEFP
jgi:hypothetical protein